MLYIRSNSLSDGYWINAIADTKGECWDGCRYAEGTTISDNISLILFLVWFIAHHDLELPLSCVWKDREILAFVIGGW